MGQNLSEPVTEKDTSLEENRFYKVGCSSMQGWRNEMEDAHTCLLELVEDKDASFFAVFDGHGGHDVARVASNNLHRKIVNNKSYRKQKIQEAIVGGYLAFDREIFTKNQHNQSGSTAISVLIRDKKIYCGNVGDSRAIASVAGEVEVLSHDHKPNVHDEHLRIINAGGWVEFNRVNGNLALSRALGDFIYKRDTNRTEDEQIVIAKPEVIVTPLTSDHEFIVLACDGIWDVMTNEEVVEFVRSAIAEGTPPDMICENLMTRCLAPDCRMGGVGCDNMTVIIVCLLQGQDYSELSSKCSRMLPASASQNCVKDRTVSQALEVDDDSEEWYDCADELVTGSVSNGIDHNERSEVVKLGEVEQQKDEEVRQEDKAAKQEDEITKLEDEIEAEEMDQEDNETKQENEEMDQEVQEMRQKDVIHRVEEVRHEDKTKQLDKKTETGIAAQTQMNNDEVKEDIMTSQFSGIDKENNSDEHDSLLSSNSNNDNQAKNTVNSKQTNSLLDGQIYKSTAV